jgi:hypothetical protein
MTNCTTKQGTRNRVKRLETGVSRALEVRCFVLCFFYYTNDYITVHYSFLASHKPRTTPAPTYTEVRDATRLELLAIFFRATTTTPTPPKPPGCVETAVAPLAWLGAKDWRVSTPYNSTHALMPNPP